MELGDGDKYDQNTLCNIVKELIKEDNGVGGNVLSRVWESRSGYFRQI